MPYDVVDENSDYDLTRSVSTGPGTQFLTMWTQENGGLTALRSHNVEGRVFVELLGAINSVGNHKHLGFEIVDVYAAPGLKIGQYILVTNSIHLKIQLTWIVVCHCNF